VPKEKNKMENYRRPPRPAARVHEVQRSVPFGTDQRRPVQYGRQPVVPRAGAPVYKPDYPGELALAAQAQTLPAEPGLTQETATTSANVEVHLRLPSLSLPNSRWLKALNRQIHRGLQQLRTLWRSLNQTKFGRHFADFRVRAVFILLFVVMLADIVLPSFQSQFASKVYSLGAADKYLSAVNQQMADKLKLDNQGAYNFNQGYTPPAGNVASATGPQITATAAKDPAKGLTVTDPTHNISFGFTPDFKLWQGKQDGNRVVYPLADGTGWLVYTMHAIGVKEDLLLRSATTDTRRFNYKLELKDGLVARGEVDGSLGIYGSTLLSGNVSTGSDADAALLQKARQNGQKADLLFSIPAPTFQADRGSKSIKGKYTVTAGNQLHLSVSGLSKASYPLDIDPSVYVTSASQFMRGNNETNIAFDAADDLIQKGKTTGARIDAWSSTNNLNAAVWGQGTAVAGGYIYSAGGSSGTTPTYVTYYTSGTNNWVVPAGVTSLTIQAWGAGGGGGRNSSSAGGNGGGGGYAKEVATVTPGNSLSILVGSGGSKAAGNLRGGNGGGYSSVTNSTTATLLVKAGGGGGGGGARGGATGGDGGAGGGTSGIAGSAGSGASSGGGGNPGTSGTFGTGGTAGTGGAAGASGAANAGGNAAGNGGTCASAGSGTGGNGGSGGGGSGGSDTSTCSNGGGGGGGRFGGGGGGSTTTNARGGGGGGGGSSFLSVSGVETQGSGQTPGNNGDSHNNGAGQGGNGGSTTGNTTDGADGGVVLSYAVGTPAVTASLSWAHFNTATNEIDSPNPGTGTCSGWCTNSIYDLPVALKNLQLVAYNGFLYALGGENSGGTPQSTVYIAKLGANGEPQLWHPSGGTPVYWYQDTSMPAARSKFTTAVYNNKLYILGGLTTSTNVLSSNTVQSASVNPTGTLTAFSSTGMQNLTSNRYGLSAQQYNGYIYVLGGDTVNVGTQSTPITTVEYAKLNSDGSMNSWQTTSAFSGGRMGMGGSFSAIWGGYLYVGGGCSGTNSVNAAGYCTTIASDVQLASINADGSLDTWNTIIGLTNQRIGYTFIAWQNGLYRLGGCRTQDTSSGDCTDTVFDVDYGVINQDGEASTVASSQPSGTAPCSGGSPTECDLPGVSIIGNVLGGSAIMNGYLYMWGGCSNTTSGCSSVSRGVIYASIGSDGTLTKPASCGAWTAVDSYCYNTTSLPAAMGAPGTAVFNGRIYSIGGFTASGMNNNIYYAAPNSDGSITSWSSTSLTGTGATSVSYAFSFVRANPASAGSVPGNLYILGGCTNATGIGCPAAANGYTDAVYKCNLSTAGVPSSCSTTGQMQIGTIPGASSAGLGAMAGTVYANYIYLMGGITNGANDLKTTRYAKIDNSNNIVDVSSGLSTGSWTESTSLTDFGRRRGSGFGYNGYLYVVGGYDGTGGGNVLADIEFAKINVSDGSIGSWKVSSININQRWGLNLRVSNSYAYVIGGCISGAAPTCDAAGQTNSIQTFQIYNNDAGTPAGYSTSANTYATNPNRIGASSAILNGYLYVAGGCTVMNTSGVCTTAVDTVSYSAIDVYGNLGSWSNTSANLTAVRTWGKLEAAGGTLYYIGGQSSTETDERGEVYYGTPSSGNVSSWSTATNALPAGRTKFGATVWNNRIYVVGGLDTSAAITATVYVSPQLSGGGNITSAWNTSSTSLSVAREGPMVTAYANNLYVFGGDDKTNYLADGQYAQINSSTGLVSGGWTYTTSLPTPLSMGDAFAANGYMYVIGGRSATTSCRPITLVAPISANTTIASGNNPTGVGEWYETNQRYTGDRYGSAASYYNGKAYVTGGGCGTTLTYGSPVTQQTTLLSQPQIAQYSIMIDADTDVFPTKYLLNGIDNGVGASWQLSYQSMKNTTSICLGSAMTTWGQVTNVGNITLGTPGTYTPKDGSGTNTTCARFFYLNVSIDASQTFGYPEDISRGPTINDLTLQFTADPSKRLMHGRTFLGGQQQPLDTPF
jgi:hypothetical protein